MITSKQRSKLRGLANNLKPLFQIGKDNLGQNLIHQLDEYLEIHEIVKVRILQASTDKARPVCDEIAKKLNAEAVSSVGSTFVLYRRSIENPTIDLKQL
ncbi:MAG: YhbY family RNA-binding protein [Clostridiales bacterium]|nr:YhbY family RNA-binding protein [Clostridiales bacterium]